MVHELCDRLVILEPMIEIVVPIIYVLNIWAILEIRVEETEDERQAKKKRKHEDKDAKKKARSESIQSERD